MVVVEYAKSNRATCRTCSKFIPEGALKLGTAKNNDGYLNIEWHHEDCFWNKRSKKYFYRGRKKINIVLKVEQFSNMEVLTEEDRQRIIDGVLKVNLANATPAALEKAGIEVNAKIVNEPVANEVEREPEPQPAVTGKKRKKSA